MTLGTRTLIEALEDHRTYLVVSSGLFALGFVAGVTLSLPDLLVPESWEPTLTSSATSIALHNLVVLALVLLGALLAGSTTFLLLSYNGLVAGVIVQGALSAGAGPLDMILLVAPHGVFEIPAFCLAGAVAFKVPHDFLRYVRSRKEYFLDREEVGQMYVLVGVAVALVLVGAVVEAVVTPALYQLAQ